MRYTQGDVVWVNFPFTDGVSSKRRPALVISGERVNRNGEYILMQVTSKNHHDDLSFPLRSSDYTETPLVVESFLRLHKIFILSGTLLIGKASHISEKSFEDIKLSFLKQLF